MYQESFKQLVGFISESYNRTKIFCSKHVHKWSLNLLTNDKRKWFSTKLRERISNSSPSFTVELIVSAVFFITWWVEEDGSADGSVGWGGEGKVEKERKYVDVDVGAKRKAKDKTVK